MSILLMVFTVEDRSARDVARQLLANWYSAWNDHDPAAIATLVADDARYEDGSGRSLNIRGRAAIERYARISFMFVSGMRFEEIEEWVSPGGAVITSYFKLTGSLARGGGRVEALGMDRSELAGGLIARHQIFWDGRRPTFGGRSERL